MGRGGPIKVSVRCGLSASRGGRTYNVEVARVVGRDAIIWRHPVSGSSFTAAVGDDVRSVALEHRLARIARPGDYIHRAKLIRGIWETQGNNLLMSHVLNRSRAYAGELEVVATVTGVGKR